MAHSPALGKFDTLTPGQINLDMEGMLTEAQAIKDLREDVRGLKVSIPNPGPLGLFSFGMTTLLSMMIAVGAVEAKSNTFLIAQGYFHGGLLQLLAGMWEFRKGNIFGATVFSTYGVYWIVDMTILLTTTLDNTKFPISKEGKALWLAQWAMLTFIFGACTLKTNRILQGVFFFLILTFSSLSIGVYSVGFLRFAGLLGILTALLAIYLGAAELVNDIYNRVILPIFPVMKME